MKKILFLCHGNICRSPMAEYIFKDRINKYNLIDKYEVASKALTYEEIGNDIYPPAKRCLDRHNIKYSSRQATIFQKSDYDYYDEIYIMDDSNMRIISRMINDSNDKVRLLNGHIEDPWYSDNFDKVFNQIAEGVDNILKRDNVL